MSEQDPAEGSQEGEVEEPRTTIAQATITEGLSRVQRIADGSSYAFSSLDLMEKEVQELSTLLRPYIHLQNINLSKNEIRDISEVVHLPYLLTINASSNQVKDISFFRHFADNLQYLQILDLSQNKIKEMVELKQPRLTRLLLSENELASFQNFNGHENILYLEIKKNKLTDCNAIANMPKLQELYLNENEINDIYGLLNLPALKRLDLNTNKLESFNDLPVLPSLEVFDCSNNPIEKAEELPKLGQLISLNSLAMGGCPFADEKGDDFKKEVLIALDQLKIKTVNEDEVTEEDIQGAKEEKEERIRAAKEAEEEAARLAAEKEAEGAEGEEAEEE